MIKTLLLAGFFLALRRFVWVPLGRKVKPRIHTDASQQEWKWGCASNPEWDGIVRLFIRVDPCIIYSLVPENLPSLIDIELLFACHFIAKFRQPRLSQPAERTLIPKTGADPSTAAPATACRPPGKSHRPHRDRQSAGTPFGHPPGGSRCRWSFRTFGTSGAVW